MKHIAIEVMTTPWGKFWRVAEQTHRKMEFASNDDSRFEASNGFYLSSALFPDTYPNTACLRGDDTTKDNLVLRVLSEAWLGELRVAVREYNETFSDEPKTDPVQFPIERIE